MKVGLGLTESSRWKTCFCPVKYIFSALWLSTAHFSWLELQHNSIRKISLALPPLSSRRLRLLLSRILLFPLIQSCFLLCLEEESLLVRSQNHTPCPPFESPRVGHKVQHRIKDFGAMLRLIPEIPSNGRKIVNPFFIKAKIELKPEIMLRHARSLVLS